MAHPLFHAKSSARKYGGKPGDYLAIHNWFDESKSHMGDVRHRALRHHAEGIFLCEKLFGVSITNTAFLRDLDFQLLQTVLPTLENQTVQTKSHKSTSPFPEAVG